MVTKYYLYARKSTEDDDHQIMSIEAQLFELREFAKREHLDIIAEFTESKSAKKPGREQFGELIKRVEQLDGVGILAWHPDRLARNSVDGGKVIYLVDTGKIVALRFPTFWFEPTPQGLFMLQVAFGQSKYYSDNLVENINRGFRQKIRRGEWLTKAPFGYVNNPKTRNLEPHPFQSKVVVKAFEQFATGQYTYESLADFMVELGVETKNRTRLGKASIWRMLSNRAYLGLTKHKGEYFEGTFQPIISPETFEAVQKVLKRHARVRNGKRYRNFPLTGLLSCGACGCAITAALVTGKSGGKFRYYHCTKKKGKCVQGALQEKQLASQLKEQLQTIALPDAWTDSMLSQVSLWEKEENSSAQTVLQTRKTSLLAVQEKLDKLVSAYIDGEIPKESYLVKKESLLKQKLALAKNVKDSDQTGKNWIKPLTQWILDVKEATFVASSDNLSEIKQVVQKVGLNPQLLNKSVQLQFRPPWNFTPDLLGKELIHPARSAQKLHSDSSQIKESFLWWRWGELNPRPEVIGIAIIHKISQLVVLCCIVTDNKPAQSIYKVQTQQVNQPLRVYSLIS